MKNQAVLLQQSPDRRQSALNKRIRLPLDAHVKLGVLHAVYACKVITKSNLPSPWGHSGCRKLRSTNSTRATCTPRRLRASWCMAGEKSSATYREMLGRPSNKCLARKPGPEPNSSTSTVPASDTGSICLANASKNSVLQGRFYITVDSHSKASGRVLKSMGLGTSLFIEASLPQWSSAQAD